MKPRAMFAVLLTPVLLFVLCAFVELRASAERMSVRRAYTAGIEFGRLAWRDTAPTAGECVRVLAGGER
jgi:hypothetical protein